MKVPVPILVRDLHFPLEDVQQHDWYNGDPLLTTYIDAMSIFFPVGERFFIKSVKHYADRVEDPEFREDIRRFCIQEAYHTREHEIYNAQLAAYGYDVEKMEARAKRALGAVKKPLYQLAFTVAIEHLTASFSSLVLKDPKVLEHATPVYRRLWTWHALEEMEHKGVAFDLYQQVTQHLPGWKRYLLRTVVLAIVTFYLQRIWLINFVEMMRFRGESTGLRMIKRWFGLMFGKPGIYRRILGHYFSFYRPFFHPWKGDDGSLVQQGRAHLESMVGQESADAGSTV